MEEPGKKRRETVEKMREWKKYVRNFVGEGE